MAAEVLTMAVKVESFRREHLEALEALSRRCLIFHRVTGHMVWRCTYGDPNFDPELALVSVEDGRVVGFMLGSRRAKAPVPNPSDPTAFIKAFCVDPGYRRRGVANTMLEALEERLRAVGCEELRATDCASWHFFPGVDVRYEDALDFLEHRGFRKAGEAVNYLLDLSRFWFLRRVHNVEEAFEAEGIVFRRPGPAERDRVSAWVAEKFSPFWGYEAAATFGEQGVKTLVAEEGGETLGFASYGGLEPEWFGPIGVEERLRGKGIGSVLLFKALESMREEGLSEAVIPWTSHLFFYTQVPGVKGVEHYVILSKKLGD